MRRSFFLLFGITLCLNGYAEINLTSLNSSAIQEWDVKIFSGETIYSLGKYKGRLGLKALSNNTASGLFLKKQIDLIKTPYLSWSWLVEKQLLELDERSKSGDDFSARIYVVIDGGLLFWRTQSVNYGWSSNQEKGLVWENPFAGSKVKMISVQGKAAKKGHWYEEKRHVYQDLINTLGDKGSEEANREAYQYIDIVAIMTDTDNSGKDAESYYGDIVFSAM
jgi:hypothetical protein